MDNNHLLDALDNLDIGEFEFDDIDVELNDLEKKRIRSRYRQAIKNKLSLPKKIAIVAGLSIMISTGAFFSSPVRASNIPVLNSIYEMLGVYDEYIDYSQYIGQSIDVEGGTYTLEEIMVTPYSSLFAIRITRNEPLPEGYEGFMVTSSIGGVQFTSATTSIHKIDDYNMIQVIESRYSSKIPKKSTINISIHEMSTEDNPATLGHGNFEFKVDFGKSYDEFAYLPIKKAKLASYGLKFKEINSSIMGTQILGDIKTINKSEKKYHENVNNLYCLLNIDGKIYGSFTSFGTTSLGKLISGDGSFIFDGLKVDEFRNSEKITLSVFKAKYNSEELISIYSSEENQEIVEANNDESNTITENNVTYSKNINFLDRRKGDFYKLERTNDNIKLYYNGSSQDITLLTSITAHSNNGLKIHYPTIYANPEKENEYIIEFTGIDENLELTIHTMLNYADEYIFLDEFKIK